jgi:streptogramin lyase
MAIIKERAKTFPLWFQNDAINIHYGDEYDRCLQNLPVGAQTDDFTTIGGAVPNNIGGALSKDGTTIYFTPFATSMIKVDTTTDTVSTIAATTGYTGSVLADNGHIYMSGFSATTIQKLNTDTEGLSTFGTPGSGYYGIIKALNGKLYCVPYNASQVYKIDPDTDTGASIGSVYAAAQKYIGGCVAPNGNIYCPPFAATDILKIDPSTDTTSTIGSGLTGNYDSATLAPNGFIYCIPRSSGSPIIKINPATDAVTTFGATPAGVSVIGSVLAPNGKIIGAPSDSDSSNTYFVLDPSDDSTYTVDMSSLPAATGGNRGAVLSSNGHVYFCPFGGGIVVKVLSALDVDQSFANSNFLNGI